MSSDGGPYPDRATAETIFFEAAQKTSAAERASYLAMACAGNETLRRQLEELLEARLDLGEFLEDSPVHASMGSRPGAETNPSEAPGLAGRQLGPYTLRERVGEGGCGIVYVAEQVHPIRRRVALKIIKLGMDTRQVVARFEAERQALALMDHPNIAKVLDAGTTASGRPYFVMELVRGRKITEYCDQHRLDTRQRLDLFLEVCRAVQHAHQKGIIHRDLKPSNILVTVNDGRAVPKVIDFGIAKAIEGRLTDKTIYTAMHEFIGTPAYMSPEQAALTSLDIDTRCDIYSLGVVLYELLTGRPPFETQALLAQGFDQMRRTICEVDPPRPSTRLSTLIGLDLEAVARTHRSGLPKLIGLIRGDLDWIVMKCLEKDRARRYDTANGLAADVERCLRNEPIVARPPSAAYQFQKFARRNRLILAAATGIVIALAVGLGFATVMFFKERRARQTAQTAEEAKDRALGEAQTARTRAEQERLVARRHAYASDVRLAQYQFDSLDIGHALEILNRYLPRANNLPEVRGFEWRHLWQLCQGSPHDSFSQQFDDPWSLDVSPDGRFLAVATGSGAKALVTVLNLATHETVARLEDDQSADGDTASARFTDDGARLVTACHRRVKFFHTASWIEEPALTLTNVSGPIDIRGDILASTAPGHFDHPARWDEMKIWNLLTRASRTITNVAGPPVLTRDGRRIVLNSGEGLKVWRLDDATAPPTLLAGSSNVLKHASGYQSLYRCLDVSPDGRRVAVGGDHPNLRGEVPIRVWDVQTGARVDQDQLSGHSMNVPGVSWSADGTQIASCSADSTVRIWDLDRLVCRKVLRGHLAELWAVVFHPDNRKVISMSVRPQSDRIKIWALDSSETATGPPHQWLPVWLSRDGNEVLGATESRDAILWNRRTGLLSQQITAPPGLPGVDLHIVGLNLIAGDRPLYIFEAFANGIVASWPLEPTGFPRLLHAHSGAVTGLARTPDGRLLITSGLDKTIKWWDLATGTLVRSNVLSGRVIALASSPDLATITAVVDGPENAAASASRQSLCSWESTSGRATGSLVLGALVDRLAYSPDGKELAGQGLDSAGNWHTLFLDLATQTWRPSLDGKGRELTYSPDSSKLIIWDKIWNLRANPPSSQVLSGHRQALMLPAFSPDSLTAVTTGDDGTVRLWNAETAQEMFSHQEAGRTFCFPVFSGDGTTLAVGSWTGDGRPIRFLDAPALGQIDALIREGKQNQ